MNVNSTQPDTNLFYHLIRCRNSINQLLAQEYNYYEYSNISNPYLNPYTHLYSPYYNHYQPSYIPTRNRTRNYGNTRNHINSLVEMMEQLQQLNQRYQRPTHSRPSYNQSTTNYTTSSPLDNRPRNNTNNTTANNPRENLFSFLNPNYRIPLSRNNTSQTTTTRRPPTPEPPNENRNRNGENNTPHQTGSTQFSYNFSNIPQNIQTNLNNLNNLSNLSNLSYSTRDTFDTSEVRERLRQVLPELVEITLYSDGRVINTDNLEDVPIPTNLSSLRQNTTVGTYENLRLPNTDNNCSICRETFANDDIVRRINSCQHVFHMNCLDTWLETHTSCPICRTDVREGTEGPPTPMDDENENDTDTNYSNDNTYNSNEDIENID